jgi:hypothetical protein
MWLLNVHSCTLHEFQGDQVPWNKYAILSHTWGDDEVTFRDLDERPDTARHKKGFKKVEGCCRRAADDGYQWAWVDSCCI